MEEFSSRDHGFRGGFNRGANSGRGRNNLNSNGGIICQICSIAGHSANRCWYRFDQGYGSNQQRQPQPQPRSPIFSQLNHCIPEAHLANLRLTSPPSRAGTSTYDSANCNPENIWYPDSGATNHVSPNLSNMNTGAEYHGNTQLQMGNGQGTHIAHVGKHVPCRNVSGLGCDEYYNCPAWDVINPRREGPVYGTGPPDCCSMAYESVGSVNLSRLECEGYSSAYSLAPLRVSGPGQWAYGIEVRYSVEGSEVLCRACEMSGGSCGFDVDKNQDLCICGTWNSTTNCDSVQSEYASAAFRRKWSSVIGLAGLSINAIMWWNSIKFR